jgi:arylsulfatase A-like enzyme
VTKPHAKWNVPERFYREYMNSSFGLPDNMYSPASQPPMAFTAELDGQETVALGNATCVPGSPVTDALTSSWPLPSPNNNTVPDWATKILRAGYFSAVSLADYHLGMVLDELDALGLANNTIVIFCSDHGYVTWLRLGGRWCWQRLAASVRLFVLPPCVAAIP